MHGTIHGLGGHSVDCPGPIAPECHRLAWKAIMERNDGFVNTRFHKPMTKSITPTGPGVH